MWLAEVAIDLSAIRANVAVLGRATSAAIMAVVKADGYGHGIVPASKAALAGGATWLGVCTLEEAAQLRDAGVSAPILAWLWMPGQPVQQAIERDVDLGVSTKAQLAAIVSAARNAGRVAGTHLKIDTGLSRGGSSATDWPALLEAAAKAQADGMIQVTGVWSHLAKADLPGDKSIDVQLKAFHEALDMARRCGIDPPLQHLANSPSVLTRPDTHFNLVRAGVSVYGLSPIKGETFGLRPAMTVRARVLYAKRVPANQGVSYGYTYVTSQPTTLAVVPIGYGDGVIRHASNVAPVSINGTRYQIAGTVCMDQFMVDVGDAPVREGDEVVLFGPGDRGEPTADDWAAAVGTINYEIVTRIGSSRVPKVYTGE